MILVMLVNAEWSTDLKWSAKKVCQKRKQENFLLFFSIVLFFSMGTVVSLFVICRNILGDFLISKNCTDIFFSKYI
jgi:hypothetical protein